MIFGLFPEQVDPDFIDRFFLPFLFLSFLRRGEPVREKGRDERASVSGGDTSLDRPFDCPSWRATDISDREVCNSIVLFIVQSSVNRDASSRRILSIILTLVLATFSCAKERQRESIYIYIYIYIYISSIVKYSYVHAFHDSRTSP